MIREESQLKGISELNVTIIGLGLIGGSMALAIRQLEPRSLWVVDQNSKVREMASAAAVADEVFADPTLPLGKSDLVILCLYPQAVADFLEKYRECFRTGALITDVSGIKTSLLAQINHFLRPDLDFVGGHPMAGKESWGFANASASIFAGANYILTPTVRNKTQNIRFLAQLFLDIGFAKVTSATPEYHDEMIALTSQLPHVISISLANCIASDDISDFVGGSFKDYTRVAAINTELWAELFLTNKENLLNQIERFQKNIEQLKKALTDHDQQSLQEIMAQGARKREVLF
ncbi:Prephenate dehydrogenase [Syntrophobotulus glycolicus DSM 8271]|uniref:Prephenate dehydrogenase n=1 Tax=Syntrophobotulus glycolicus (strain DSM 8271 / FlGlyR) TaxID=645991 RepID=F0SUU5_SYNGF|nr:prephenate dehydrogenase [Syntrophobotulus glycolicus]ADY56661.1 Prephenate dehydrogenase [Syntrophobotulus glycolicus DSM 8271]